MDQKSTSEIYMIKKSTEGFIVSFRLGTRHGVEPGMDLAVLNEDGFSVGTVQVVASTETESDALVAGESAIKLGCRVSLSGTTKAS
ncbi:MAG: hypothetical protein MUC33_20040 [Desulfobacterales bacterium]|jgi:hypothetical protein|nr:hypothetical protein [Desulfobacterales bacterium]